MAVVNKLRHQSTLQYFVHCWRLLLSNLKTKNGNDKHRVRNVFLAPNLNFQKGTDFKCT